MKKQILATARPNKTYINIENLKNVEIQARLVNGQIRFYELINGRENKCLSHDFVKSLFVPGKRVYNQPFLIKENENFYALVFKHLKSNQALYNKLISNPFKPELC